MNDFQEAILDTLMVADPLGHRGPKAPLTLALEALKNAGLTRRSEPGPALGFPRVLCAAVEGASATIRTVDDCRALAISLFSEVRPRQRTPRVDARRLVKAVLWSLQHVPSYREPEHASAAEVVDLFEEHLAGQPCAEATIERLSSQLDRAIARTESGAEFAPQGLALSAFYFALHTLRRAQAGEEPEGPRRKRDEDVETNACRATRDTARLAGLVGGVPAAVAYCVELARTLGM
jgi:hypothetical protein